MRLGIGSGVGSAVERMGMSYARPVTALGEAIAIVRALLAGEEVTFSGEVFKVDRVKLDYTPRRDIAIFMAGRGDRSLALCGERADGLLVSNMCTAAFVARSAALVREAAVRAGRTGPLGVVRYMPCCVHADRAEASAAAKRAIGEMLPAYWRLGQRLKGAKQALTMESGISEVEAGRRKLLAQECSNSTAKIGVTSRTPSSTKAASSADTKASNEKQISRMMRRSTRSAT